MKALFFRCFDPAIGFLNRYSFPRKFAIAGMLVVLPLFFVTCQYIETLNERVELSQQELDGNQSIRLLIPLWRTLREVAPATNASTPVAPDYERDVRARLQLQLDRMNAIDAKQLHLLHSSTHWNSFTAKLQLLLSEAPPEQLSLSDPSVHAELLDNFHAILRDVADLSKLSVDQHLDSQRLALSITTLIPSLIDQQDRLRDRIADGGTAQSVDRRDVELAELNGVLRVLNDSVREHLSFSAGHNSIVAERLQGSLVASHASVQRIEAAIRERNLRTDDEVPLLTDIDTQTVQSLRKTLTLLEACQDAFDGVVQTRMRQARMWRFELLLAAFAPLTLAAYLVVGLCMAIVKTANQMRDVTDCILAERGCDAVSMTVHAQDELGRMIEHYSRLAVRLREELALAHAEAVRASSAEESLRVNQERFNLVLQGANDGIWDWDLQTDRVFYSDRFKELLGYDKGEFDVWLSALADVLHPDDFDMTWRAVERHFQDREPYHIEHRLKISSGEYRWFLERGQAVWDENGVPIRMAGSIKDITVRKAIETSDRVRNEVLEMLAAGSSLTDVLGPLIRNVETENSTLRAAVMYLDKDRNRLLNGAAPSLPDEFIHALLERDVNAGVGSCGTSALLGQRIVVEDISLNPNWTVLLDLARESFLQSCLCEPIRGMSGTVLGTLAIFGTNTGIPSESDIRMIEETANLAGVAIERKQVDAALQESEERWKFALEGAGDGVWDWNIQTGEMIFSRRWSEILGFTEHELAGNIDEWKSRVEPDDLPKVMGSLQDYLNGKNVTYMHEYRMRCRDGSVKWILSRGIVVSCDSTGAALRMIGTHSDITDRKRMEEDTRRYLQQVEASRDRITEQSIQLIRQSEELARARDQAEAAARAKSEFLANMSHELRTPLTAILGYADLLYDEGGADANAQHQETVDIIRSNGRHLQELIDDILDLSKIEADRMTLEWNQVSPRQLVEDVLRLMQLRAKEKGLVLQTEYHFPLPERITTDALRVRQVLVNLVGNAIKFTAHGVITVSVRYDVQSSCQVFSVSDTGIGIRQDQLQRLFTPFSQADASMSRRFGGTGLGLSISKRLAQMLGGDIIATSTFGEGSTFMLQIRAELCDGASMMTGEPIEPIRAAQLASPVVQPALKLSGRILLAEDVPANQKLIAFLLQKWGASVQVVDNGALAVDAALQARASGTTFDLILMDIQMPEMDGYTATALLRSKDYTGQIIALTAHASDDDRERCLASGFDGFAVKPIQREQLYSVCRDHLESAAIKSAKAVS